MTIRTVFSAGLAALLAVASTASALSPVPAGTPSPMGEILKVFATGGDYDAYAKLQSVEWGAPEGVEAGKFRHNTAYKQQGKTQLWGFGSRDDMPSGAGADATTVRGNEGQAFVTLNGLRKGGVYQIDAQKFFETQDYLQTLEYQLGSTAKVKTLATDCQLDDSGEPAPDARRAFYQIDFPGADPVFAEISIAEGMKYSPEVTLFTFLKRDPAPEIADGKCMPRSGDSALDTILSADGFYSQKRDRILAAGWQPVVNERCRERVYGGDEAGWPKKNEFDICVAVPEVHGCGYGLCWMRYKDAGGKIVEITTYGSGQDRKHPDYDALVVAQWRQQ